MRDVRDRRSRRHGDARRPRRDPAPRAGHGAVRGDDQRVAGAHGRDRRARRWDAVRAVCERWDLPVAVIGRVTEDGDIVVLGRPAALDPDGRPVAGAASSPASPPVRSHPRRSCSSASHVAPAAPSGRPRTRRGRAAATAARPRPGPGRGAAGAPRVGRTSRRAAPVFEQYDSTVRRHRRRPGPRRGRAPDQGNDEGARRHDRRQRPRRRARPVAGRRDVRRRGHPQRVDHRRPAARRDELPQLRRPDPAGGVLAALGGRPRPRRRVPRPGAARHRRQRLPLQRVAGRRDRPDARDRHRRPPRRRRDARRTRRSAPRATRSCCVGETVPGLAGSVYASARRRRAGGRPAAARPRARGRRPGVHPRGDRPRPRRDRRRTCRAAGSRSRSRRCAIWGGVGARRSGWRRRLAGRRAVRREPVATRRRGRAAPRAGVRAARRASTACRSTRSARSAARGSSSSSPATARPAPPRSAAAGSRTRSRSRSRTCATPGTMACRARSAGRRREPHLARR